MNTFSNQSRKNIKPYLSKFIISYWDVSLLYARLYRFRVRGPVIVSSQFSLLGPRGYHRKNPRHRLPSLGTVCSHQGIGYIRKVPPDLDRCPKDNQPSLLLYNSLTYNLYISSITSTSYACDNPEI